MPSKSAPGRLALLIGFSIAGAPLLANAQTQIKPRVMIMVDTSGSMTDDFAGNATGGDGSTFYRDSLITRDVGVDFNLTPYIGTEVSPVTNQCVPVNTPPANEAYSGYQSRLFAAKAAVTNVLNGSGNVEWGLERYTADTACTVFTHTFTPNAGGAPNLGVIPEPPGRCTRDSDCLNGATCDTVNNECRCVIAATDCNFNGGAWTCTGGHCKAGNNAACPAPFVRNGGATNHCECAANSACGNGTCGGGLCNCTGACGATSCDATQRTCGPCSSSGQCSAGSVCSAGGCGTFADFQAQSCTLTTDCETGQTCSGGKCTCTRDDDCRNTNILGFTSGQVCFSGTCGVDLNQCWYSGYRETSTRDNTACGAHSVTRGGTYNGTCGTSQTTANTAPCNSKQVCYQNSDCGSNDCRKTAATDGWGECFCTTDATCRSTADYDCVANRCQYVQPCESVGGNILVDPAAAGYTPSSILLFANGREDLVNGDPELRSGGLTPLAGAARTAMSWYNQIKSYSLVNGTSANCLAGTDPNPLCDPKILCRPYSVVLVTDGADTCEANAGGNNSEGPVAAAAGFVDATPSGARIANKVYVIGLAADAALQTVLNDTAKMGGTQKAAFANNESDLEKALADIVAGSVLVEKCNYIDDDCNSVVDEHFPDINASCNNGAVGHCAATGKFKCTGDQLGETCGPASCRNGAGTSLTKVDATHARLNGVAGFTAADVGRSITIVSARLAANRGTFVVSSVNAPANSVTFVNAAGVDEAFPAGFEILCNSQTSCRGSNGAGPLTQAGTTTTLAGVTGFTAADVGDSLTVSGASNAANNGTFPITAQTGTTVTYVNAAGVAETGGAITWAIDCRSPSCRRGTGANFAGKAGSNITLTGGSGFTAADVNKTLTVRAAQNAANVGNFTITAFISASSVTVTNPSGVNEAAGAVQWNIYCANAESLGGCNNFDDDCNSVPDDCTAGVAGSCCFSSGCQAVEVCNGLDDDCNGIIDDNPVDVGFACGNSVGDCEPGVVQCCAADPATTGGVCNPPPSAGDRPYCIGGNPGYPKGADLCDGTDDNCDGTVNGTPPHPCYNDPTSPQNPFPPGLAGHGVCHAGNQSCNTAALPAGSPLCPVPWPAGKSCPNGTPTYGACAGAVGPHAEVCNGFDDDCNDTIDDNVSDPWLGTPCCPTGNAADCTNSGAGTRCHAGAFTCVAGHPTCTGAVARSPEICDGLDDDCNGIVDDVPGLGTSCSANGARNTGACHATFICVPGSPGMCDGVACPNGLTCDQTVAPGVEVCNGIDDDCNDVVDDPAEVAANDPALKMPCDVPAPPNDKPPCKAGAPICRNGVVECQGAVVPRASVCGQPSTDCSGNPSTVCPTGSTCFMGNCVTACGTGDFPCPGGFVCDRTQAPPLCVPSACGAAHCPAGSLCVVDANGGATCSGPCAGVSCPSGFRCQGGACVDDSCQTSGCPAGQLCVGNPGSCVADPCANVECDTTQYCANGTCVPLCPVCMKGERCVNGLCQSDPCAGVSCAAGQVCAIAGGVGTCVTNMCLGVTCGSGQVCCGGGCSDDPCLVVRCPDGIACAVDGACNATCSAPAANTPSGASGCSMAPRGDDSWPLLLLVAGFLFVRRREQEAR